MLIHKYYSNWRKSGWEITACLNIKRRLARYHAESSPPSPMKLTRCWPVYPNARALNFLLYHLWDEAFIPVSSKGDVCMSVNYMDIIHCLTAWHTILKTTGKPWQLMVLNPTKLISDVPLGKRLGPLYFFIHINGLPSVVTSKVLLFASDCLLHWGYLIDCRRGCVATASYSSGMQWDDRWGHVIQCR